MNEKTISIIGYITSGAGALAAVLNILLIKECFIIWTLGNFWWIYRGFASKDIRPQLPLFIVFTILNIWGFIQWGGFK